MPDPLELLVLKIDMPPDGNYGTNELGKGPSSKEFNLLLGIVITVQVVLMALVVTLVVESFGSSQATYQDLKDQVTDQNAKMDVLIVELSKNPGLENTSQLISTPQP